MLHNLFVSVKSEISFFPLSNILSDKITFMTFYGSNLNHPWLTNEYVSLIKELYKNYVSVSCVILVYVLFSHFTSLELS